MECVFVRRGELNIRYFEVYLSVLDIIPNKIDA